jgi:DNA-binding response OmpR family regulator
MDASFDHDSPLKPVSPGRFTRVSVQTPAGEIEARLSEHGNWELRVRHDQETHWRLACTGDLDCGAVTAQPAAVAEEVITRGSLTVDPAGRRATVGGTAVCLSRKEFALLLALAAQPDRVFSKEELMATIWGYTGLARTRTLDSHASRVRSKLRRAGARGLIVNCRGVGYRLWDRTDLTTFPPLSPVGEAA